MANDSSTKVWATAPAAKFYDSSPLGNGRIGAMVFGGVQEDRIVLNESTVWSGSPQDADREDAVNVLPEIRRLLLSNQPRKAQELLQQNFVCKGPGSSQGRRDIAVVRRVLHVARGAQIGRASCRERV